MINSEDLFKKHLCDNSTVLFNIGLEYLGIQTNIKVTHYNFVTLAETLLTLGVDYTVDTDNDTITTTSTYPGNGVAGTSDTLTITYAVPLTQKTDITANSNYDPEVLEEAYDHGVLLSKQINEITERSIRLDTSDAGEKMILPPKATLANGVLGFDENGDPQVYPGLVPRTYDPAYTYLTNDIIQYSGKFFICLSESTGNTPTGGTSDSYWYMLNFDGINYDATVYFMTDDIVEYTGFLFKSLVDDNLANTPLLTAGDTKWRMISTDINYHVAINYMTDDIVESSGYLFKSLVDDNQGDTPLLVTGDTKWRMIPQNMLFHLAINYMTGYQTESRGYLYKSKGDNNQGHTPAYPNGDAYWERVFTKGDSGDIQPWDFANQYTADTVVSLRTALFIAKIATMSKSPVVDHILTEPNILDGNLFNGYYQSLDSPDDLSYADWSKNNITSVTDTGQTYEDVILWKVLPVVSTNGYLRNTYTESAAGFEKRLVKCVFRKGSSDTAKLVYYNDTQTADFGQIDVTFSTQNVVVSLGGVLYQEFWPDNDTVVIIFETPSALGATDTLGYELYPNPSASGTDYTYFGHTMVIYEYYDCFAEFPFTPTNNSNAGDHRLTHDVTSTFVFDTVFKPKGNWNWANTYTVFESYLDANNYIRLIYSGAISKWIIQYKNGTAERTITSGIQFDSGSSFVKFNQRLKITGSIDISDGDISGSRLIVIALETLEMGEVTVWDNAPDIFTVSDPLFNVGRILAPLPTPSYLMGFMEYFRLWDSSLFTGVVTDEDTVNTALSTLGVPSLYVQNEDSTDYWQSWPVFGVGVSDFRLELVLVTTTERNAISDPLQGMMVYNTTQDRINVRADNSSSPRWEYSDGTDAT